MNHLKTLICGGFVGADKLERFLLLKAGPLIKECGIKAREPENISRFLYNFSFKHGKHNRKAKGINNFAMSNL